MRVKVLIEESSGDVLTFLEDDDEFEREKLGEVYKAFSQYKDVSYFHDTRRFLYYDRFVDANVGDPSIKPIVEFHESIVPHYDIILDPFDKSASNIITRYPGILATVSLMSVRRECVEDRLALLKRVHISVESFIPIFAAECGLLYHTGKRLTRYRIHDKNSSISLTREGQIRVLANLLRAVKDHELILENSSRGNRVRDFVKRSMLEARIISTFEDEEYGVVNVKGKQVVDVGAFVGDTPIYFALKGPSASTP